MADLAFIQAWTSLRRHSLVALGAVANIAVSLAILGGFLLMSANLEHMASQLAHQTTLSVDLRDNADGPAIARRLGDDPRVKAATFVSKSDALKEYAQRVNLPYRDIKSAITNPLPNLVRVTVRQTDDIEAVLRTAKAIEGVAQVRYQRDVAEKLFRVADGVKVMGLVLGAIMALAALLLVSTTIQLGVHSRRREIRIMQLVGATNGFIRAPFMVEGAVQGLLGGVVGAILLLTGYSYLHGAIAASLTFIDLIYSPQFLALFGVGLVLCGLVFGVIGSLLGTRHYLRLI